MLKPCSVYLLPIFFKHYYSIDKVCMHKVHVSLYCCWPFMDINQDQLNSVEIFMNITFHYEQRQIMEENLRMMTRKKIKRRMSQTFLIWYLYVLHASLIHLSISQKYQIMHSFSKCLCLRIDFWCINVTSSFSILQATIGTFVAWKFHFNHASQLKIHLSYFSAKPIYLFSILPGRFGW